MAADPEGIFGLVIRYGYLIVAIAALVEALPLLGWLVPGQAIIILAGAAAAAGYLNIFALILIAIPAGIIGDAVGYYIGRRYGRSFLEKYGPRLRIGPTHLDKSDRLFQKYGPFALIIARFSFLTRAVGPILAGMARMRPAVFWPVNIVGALAWSVAYATMGYAFGFGFLAIQGTIGKILAWTLLAVVGLYFFYRTLKKYADQFTRDDLFLSIMGIVGGATFGLVADRVDKRGLANGFDVNASEFRTLLEPLGPLFTIVDAATSFWVVGTAALALFVYFFVRRRWWDATLVALGVGGVILIVETLRPIFRITLPDGLGESFPSSSAAIPVVLAGIGAYLVSMRSTRRRASIFAALIGGALATTAVFAELGRGREQPSAVIAGLALGMAWLSVTVLVVEFRLKRKPA